MIYLDNSATKALSTRALEAMMPYYKDKYANPSSTYTAGIECKNAIEESRNILANILGAEPDEIYFTSGGTESDNWAIKMGGTYKDKVNIISSKIEHPAILNSLAAMEDKGCRVDYAMIKEDGLVDVNDIARLINRNTSLVSCMLVNNETGVIQPIEEIAYMSKKSGALFHTDAVQAFAHREINVKRMNIDMLSASAHKFGGPKGVGFLYISKNISINPFMNGGSQENNMRAGTSNVAGIVGMAVAAEESYTNMHRWNSKMKTMRDYMAHRIIEEIKDVKINGSMSRRSENNLNLSFKGINGYSLTEMLDLEGVCVSGTSACKAESRSVSNVLLAMGVPVEEAIGTIRITLSEKNTMEEIDRTISLIKKNVVGLRSIA